MAVKKHKHFVSGTIILPFFIPFIETFSAVSGCSVQIITTAICAGGTVSGISPASSGGATCLAGCPDNIDQGPIIKKMLLLAVINILVYFVYSLILSLIF